MISQPLIGSEMAPSPNGAWSFRRTGLTQATRNKPTFDLVRELGELRRVGYCILSINGEQQSLQPY